MSLQKVLDTLYGKLTDGYLSVTYLPNNPADSPFTKYFQAKELEEMQTYIKKCGQRYNTYVGINPRIRKLSAYQRGKREDVSAVVAAYQDYDIKGAAHKEERLPGSAEELYSFLDTLPVKPTFLLATGNGIHAYWVFETPFIITDEESRSRIESILKGWEQYVHAEARRRCGWVFDSVSDLARMLRAAATTNFKTKERPVSKVVSMTDNRCRPDDLSACSAKAGMKSTPAPEKDMFSLMGTGRAEELRKKCRFIDYCYENAEDLPEPLWFGAISNLALTADGHEAVHEMSRPYHNYTYAETEKKYRYAATANMPQTCEYIKNRLCFDCEDDCGVKAPIVLVHTNGASQSWDEPIPLDGIKVPTFPVDALPDCISDYVLAVSESTQTPVDISAVAAISVLSIGMQGKYVIRPKPDWTEPVNTFIGVFMPPSERKSAVCSAMARPMNEYEREWNKVHASEIDFNKSQKSILERRLKSLEDRASKGKVEMDEVRKASEELTDFKEIKPMRLYGDDVTTEKLVSMIAENEGKAAIFSPEGGIFDLLKGMYTRYVNIDVFLKGYSGDPIRVDRIGRESETIYNPVLTVMLMAQPSVLAGVMENGNFRGRGLTARFLYCVPESNIGKRKYRSKPVPDEVYARYAECIGNILSDEPDETPVVITLSTEADILLEAFSEELEPKLKTEYSDIADWAGKIAGNTARIAALLCRAEKRICREFLAEPEALVVSKKTMEDAIRTGKYFIEHAKAAFSLLGADEGIRNCKYVLSAIEKAELTECSRRDIMRLCRSLKTKDAVQPVIDQLVEYGYLAERQSEKGSGKGRTPSAVYLVNPAVYSKK